jgi:hypothetical protein
MKKFFISLTLFISVMSTVVNAAPVNNTDPVMPAKGSDKVSARIQYAFKKEFAGAVAIKWEQLRENIYQVHFMYDNERLNAFYDADAQLVATGRFINEQSLPLTVQTNIARKYASYRLVQAIELTRNSETSYLLTFENDQFKLEVLAYNSGNMDLFKKEKRIQ